MAKNPIPTKKPSATGLFVQRASGEAGKGMDTLKYAQKSGPYTLNTMAQAKKL